MNKKNLCTQFNFWNILCIRATYISVCANNLIFDFIKFVVFFFSFLHSTYQTLLMNQTREEKKTVTFLRNIPIFFFPSEWFFISFWQEKALRHSTFLDMNCITLCTFLVYKRNAKVKGSVYKFQTEYNNKNISFFLAASAILNLRNSFAFIIFGFRLANCIAENTLLCCCFSS